MDVLNFNPLDVLATAAVWQSANQHPKHKADNHSQHVLAENKPRKYSHPEKALPVLQRTEAPFLDHSYAYVPCCGETLSSCRDNVTNGVTNGCVGGVDVDEIDANDVGFTKLNDVDDKYARTFHIANDVQILDPVPESKKTEETNSAAEVIEESEHEVISAEDSMETVNVVPVIVVENSEERTETETAGLLNDDAILNSSSKTETVADAEEDENQCVDIPLQAEDDADSEVVVVKDDVDASLTFGSSDVADANHISGETSRPLDERPCSGPVEANNNTSKCESPADSPSTSSPTLSPPIESAQKDSSVTVAADSAISRQSTSDPVPNVTSSDTLSEVQTATSDVDKAWAAVFHRNAQNIPTSEKTENIPDIDVTDDDVTAVTSDRAAISSDESASAFAFHPQTMSMHLSAKADQFVPNHRPVQIGSKGRLLHLTPPKTSPEKATDVLKQHVLAAMGQAKSVSSSPPLLHEHTRHTCVSIDCCSPSDIGAVSRDLCMDRLSSASSQDFFPGSEDSLESSLSPRSNKSLVGDLMSPPIDRRPRRPHQRGLHIPLGPLLDDAAERGEHPLKDHDYCLHSFYLAMTHNRVDEPIRKPGPAPRHREPRAKKQMTEKGGKSKKGKKSKLDDEYDSDQSPIKEEVFSDSDSLDSPSKSRMSSPTGSDIDVLSRERMGKLREKRLNSSPNPPERPRDRPRLSASFNDHYVFFGKKPRRRARTTVENNHDKLKKFNHSEFLPGLDSSYLEARAKFHTRQEPEEQAQVKLEPVDFEMNHTNELHIPKGGLAFGISEEESQFIDSLYDDPSTLDPVFSPDQELNFTQEQVKELLNIVGEEKALKLFEGSDMIVKELSGKASDVVAGDLVDHCVNGSDLMDAVESCTGADLPAANGGLAMAFPTPTYAVSGTTTSPTQSVARSPACSSMESSVKSYTHALRPKDLPFSPLKSLHLGSVDMRLNDASHIPTLTGDLSGDLPTPDLPLVSGSHVNAILGGGADMHLEGSTSDMHLGGSAPDINLGATTPELHLGGTTPHDLLDLDDLDLLNANLNLNMNAVLNFQSPEKIYHPNASTRTVPASCVRKLDTDNKPDETYTVMDKARGSHVRNNPLTMGKPEQMLKSQMFQRLSEMAEPETHQDHGVPELITVNMYWNDLPGLLINGKQYVRLVDIHKQVLPAKPTGLLKNRCRALNLDFDLCSELQRDFLIRYAHASASRSQIIVSKDVAETLIGYYVDKPGRRPDDTVSLPGSRYSDIGDDIARLEDVTPAGRRRKKRRRINKKYVRRCVPPEPKPRGRPKGSTNAGSLNVTFKLQGVSFRKRVRRDLAEDIDSDLLDGEESGSDEEQSMSSASERLQTILSLRQRIKYLRGEMYKIQKRQQRADVRKINGLAKRQRRKPFQKPVVNYEPRRPVKVTQSVLARNLLGAGPASTAVVQTVSPFLEMAAPAVVRVAPCVDKSGHAPATGRVTPTLRAPSPAPLAGRGAGANDSGRARGNSSQINALPSAIVTPMTSMKTSAATAPSRDTTRNLPESVVCENSVINHTSTSVDNLKPSNHYNRAAPLRHTDGDPVDKRESNEKNNCALSVPSDMQALRTAVEKFVARPKATTNSMCKATKPPSRLPVQHLCFGPDGLQCDQNGFLYLNMFISAKSNCVRCATCFQQMCVDDFPDHLHSSDDGATLIRPATARPRQLLLADQHQLSNYQRSMWQQFEQKWSTPAVSLVRDTNMGTTSTNSTTTTSTNTSDNNAAISNSSNVGGGCKTSSPPFCRKKFALNVQLARVDKTNNTNKISDEPKTLKLETVKSGANFEVTERFAKPPPNVTPLAPKVSAPDTPSRFSGRVRRRKQFSPDEGYTLPKKRPKMHKSRSDSRLLTDKRPLFRLSGGAVTKPVCKVSPRPVVKVPPSASASAQSPDSAKGETLENGRARHRAMNS